VERKTETEFRKFCTKHDIAPDICWVIGDSKRSDIDPAIKAGLHAIWVPHENWHRVEGTIEPNADAYTAVQKLEDVLSILEADPVDFRPAWRPEITCYGIFEGGGARGLAHVGALKACEERNIKFAGVAGTSAGSIIAGLIAVGYLHRIEH